MAAGKIDGISVDVAEEPPVATVAAVIGGMLGFGAPATMSINIYRLRVSMVLTLSQSV